MVLKFKNIFCNFRSGITIYPIIFKLLEMVSVYLIPIPSIRDIDVELISIFPKTVVKARYILYFLFSESNLPSRLNNFGVGPLNSISIH